VSGTLRGPAESARLAMLSGSGTLQLLNAATARSQVNMGNLFESFAKAAVPSTMSNTLEALAKVTAPAVNMSNMFESFAKAAVPSTMAMSNTLEALAKVPAVNMSNMFESFAIASVPSAMFVSNTLEAFAKVSAPAVIMSNLSESLAKAAVPSTVAMSNILETLARLTAGATTMGGVLDVVAKLNAEPLGSDTAWSAAAARRAVSAGTTKSTFALAVPSLGGQRRMGGRQDLSALTREGIEYLGRNRPVIGSVLICLVAGAAVADSVVEKGWLDGQATLAMWLAVLFAYLGLVKMGAI
jgi:hypothetical protein